MNITIENAHTIEPEKPLYFFDECLDLPVDDFLRLPIKPNEKVALLGYFPHSNELLSEGEIWLMRGKHVAKFGLDHIWQGRKNALKRLNILTVRQVINHLILMLHKRVPIYPEIKDTKTAAVKTTKGAIIIEKIGVEYSAITLLTATRASPIDIVGRWGNEPLNHIQKDCKTI